MVNYQCQRCGYETFHKSVFKKHLLRKNLCDSKLKEIERFGLLKLNGFEEESIEYEELHKKTQKFFNDTLKTTKIHKCEFCNKTFSRKDSLNRHKNKFCKGKINVYKQVEELLLSVSKMKEEMNKIKKENEALKKKLKNNKSKTIINNNSNIFNAEKQTNNIQVNSYGSENIDYLSDAVFKKLLDKPITAITKLIELKHFNPNHPENHNVKITNIHDKYAKIYKDEKWLIKHRKDVIEDLVENGYADFEEFKDLNDDELTEKIKEKYKLMKENYENHFDGLCQKSELAVINGSSGHKNIDV